MALESQDKPLPIWELQEAELTNALHLKVFWKELTMKEVQQQISLFNDRRRRGLYYFPTIHRSDLMSTFRELCKNTPKLGCRTLDIMHVSCALAIGATKFISFDERQCALAQQASLSVWDVLA